MRASSEVAELLECTFGFAQDSVNQGYRFSMSARLMSDGHNWNLKEGLAMASSVDDVDTGILGRQRRHRAHERQYASGGMSGWRREELMPRDGEAQLFTRVKDLRCGHDRNVNRNDLAGR